ncbi:Crp/Fnr family transcriptional regulator [Saccharothrix sp. 6-C]|uniref:Crp/Fnr family transcriptional regulator n=1 Tax=Saccharothrix sp. 6-C TaxID=2781735 RepID=UPI0019172A8A|nr:Crp/Fnr family transcriptional regulator [Saccharothrix sp. 6-C]QQQ77029.1 Crp/Fnr family transcriptional regulator [Saccharothrix sp. 6-C]
MEPDADITKMPLLEEEDKLALKGIVINRPAGFLLFRENERTTETYLIIKGHVKVTSGGPDRVMAIRGPGEVVGEMSALDGQPRSTDVWAMEDIQVKVILQREWIDFLYSRPRVFHALVQMLSARLREATTKQSQASWFGIEQRLAKGLVELTAKLGIASADGIVIRGVSQHELAGLIGAKKRDSVSPVIRVFRDQGLLSTSRQLFVIHDLGRIKEIAEGGATALEGAK